MKTLIRTAENKQKGRMRPAGRQFDMPVLEDWLQKKIFHLKSISSTLNARILRTNVLSYIHQSQNVTRKAAEMTFVRIIRT